MSRREYMQAREEFLRELLTKLESDDHLMIVHVSKSRHEITGYFSDNPLPASMLSWVANALNPMAAAYLQPLVPPEGTKLQ